MKKILQNWFLNALGVLIAAHTSAGISYDHIATLLLLVILLSGLNLFIKPLLIFFALPFVVVSLGFGIWLINAGLLMLAGRLVPGFQVDSFGAALWGAFLISLTSLIANLFFFGKSTVVIRRRARGSPYAGEDDDDIIDV